MKLNDAIFNWLQIKAVADARPTDTAAKDTYDFFTTMIQEDHGISNIEVERDDLLYRVHYVLDNEKKSQVFDREAVDFLLRNIENEPKFNEPCPRDEE